MKGRGPDWHILVDLTRGGPLEGPPRDRNSPPDPGSSPEPWMTLVRFCWTGCLVLQLPCPCIPAYGPD